MTLCAEGDLSLGFVQFTTITNCVDTVIKVDADLINAAGCKSLDGAAGITASELLVTALEVADDAVDGDDNAADA